MAHAFHKRTCAAHDVDGPPKPPMPRTKLVNWFTNTTSPEASLVVTAAVSVELCARRGNRQ